MLMFYMDVQCVAIRASDYAAMLRSVRNAQEANVDVLERAAMDQVAAALTVAVPDVRSSAHVLVRP
ncbi:hypothetical protein KP79_PYT00862 [Mizuhopecten yessoensis]|uniref:Uncharacterized protein n=1 Tax=Mizuhopecten yessoensis TaxID=6573 RepID=A0A210QNX5_MIZYE|nr:hypothetical protein KP79_PYT00862 [Mizuhopecten yessoensis]